MSLCFLLERRYAPYPKWFGSAFQHLRCAERLGPVLWRVQRATSWQERETAFVEAQSVLADMYHVSLASLLPFQSPSHRFLTDLSR
jgi:hypothetical protein